MKRLALLLLPRVVALGEDPATWSPVFTPYEQSMQLDHHPKLGDAVLDHLREQFKWHTAMQEAQKRDDVLPGKEFKCKDEADTDCAKCKACVGKGTHRVVGEVIKHVDAFCKKDEEQTDKDMCPTEDVGEGFEGKLSKDCARRYWCKFWNEKKPVAIGFLLQKMKPWGLVHAWCMGHGDCGKKLEDFYDPNSEVAADLDTIPGLDMHEMMSAALEEGDGEKKHSPNKSTNENTNTEDDDNDDDEVDENTNGDDEDDDDDGFYPEDNRTEVMEARALFEKPAWLTRLWGGGGDHHGKKRHGHGHICPKCYKKVFGIVMKVSIWGAKKMCRRTKCPVLKKWCSWAASHREVALGMILAKVEPWKYAIGRCWSDKRGRGGRRGGRRGGHGHHRGHHRGHHPHHRGHHGGGRGHDGHHDHDDGDHHHRHHDHPHDRPHDRPRDWEHHPHHHGEGEGEDKPHWGGPWSGSQFSRVAHTSAHASPDGPPPEGPPEVAPKPPFHGFLGPFFNFMHMMRGAPPPPADMEGAAPPEAQGVKKKHSMPSLHEHPPIEHPPLLLPGPHSGEREEHPPVLHPQIVRGQHPPALFHILPLKAAAPERQPAEDRPIMATFRVSVSGKTDVPDEKKSAQADKQTEEGQSNDFFI